MKQLSVENISKSYGEKQLFKQMTFQVNPKDRIGLIGVNGTGKSSLLKIIAGLDTPDAGEITMPKDYTIGYLDQNPALDPDLTIIDQVFRGDTPMMQLMRSYEKVLSKLKEFPENTTYQNELFHLQKKMDDFNAWDASTSAKTILSKLGIEEMNRKTGQLSGGQKKRVALAQVLIEKPDLFILDEPTNHLDYASVKWLENYLNNYQGAILLVTHDRYFLDHVTNRIFELDKGTIYSYQGNYEAFISAKALREEEMLEANKKARNLYRRELAWMKRGARARSTKQKARIQRFEQLGENVEKYQPKEKLDISLRGSRLGKQVFEFVDAYHSFPDQIILKDFHWLVKPGDRIGIVGANGSGKSTFLHLLAGKLSLECGDLIRGQTVRIAYYQQENEEMDTSKRMITYIREAGEVIKTKDGETISASQMLERFLFPTSSHGTFIGQLSGGEKRRLYLLKLLMSKPNVLLLDEPTNDLDTETLTVLEDYIETFPGVVISVSHDRYFLDKTAEQLLIFHGNGKIDHFYGKYSDYLDKITMNTSKQAHPKKSVPISKEDKERRKKMSYMEKQEWEGIEDKIIEKEEQLEALQSKLNDAGSDFEFAQNVMLEIEEVNAELEHLIERWSYLSELVE